MGVDPSSHPPPPGPKAQKVRAPFYFDKQLPVHAFTNLYMFCMLFLKQLLCFNYEILLFLKYICMKMITARMLVNFGCSVVWHLL